MSKRPGRHRARFFARAVDGSGSPHPSVARLVSLANVLRGMPLRGPSPDSSLKARLLTEAAALEPAERKSLLAEWLDRMRFQRGLASTTVLCTVLIAVAGIGFGTTESLPGDTLYSMKLRSENAQLAFVGSEEERGRKNLKFADSRLDEITRLVRHKGDWPVQSSGATKKPDTDAVEKLINRTFATMDASTAAGAKAMRKAFESTGDTRPLAYLDTFTRKQQRQLRALIPTLPSGSQPTASDSLKFVGELNQETAKILGTDCGTDCTEDGQTATASTATSPPGEPSITSPSTSASSPTADGTTSSGTSAVPPSTTSTDPPASDTGTGTSDDPSDNDTSSGTGSSTGSSSGGGSSSDDTGSPDPSESTSDGGESPSASPPEPTGVPSNPSDTAPTRDSGDGAGGDQTTQKREQPATEGGDGTGGTSDAGDGAESTGR